MSEADKRKSEETPIIKEGLSAVVLPEMGKRNHFDELFPEPEAEALGKLNAFLEGLNAQGVNIVSVFDLEVDVGSRPGVIGNITETRKVAIVQKAKQG